MDAAGRIKDAPLGESNTRLTARLDDAAANLPQGWKMAVRAMEAEADEHERRTARKGICSKCHMERSCGVSRGKHICW